MLKYGKAQGKKKEAIATPPAAIIVIGAIIVVKNGNVKTFKIVNLVKLYMIEPKKLKTPDMGDSVLVTVVVTEGGIYSSFTIKGVTGVVAMVFEINRVVG